MDNTLFMDLMSVAYDDYRAHDNSIEGIILITVRKNRKDNLAAQVGTTVAPETVAYVLEMLLDHITTGSGRFTRIPPKNMIRKAV